MDILSNQKERYDDPQTQYYPFADKDTREQLRHTFWKLPSTAAVKLLAKKLRTHEFFSQYKVIEAAGSKEGRSSIKAEKEVKAAIGDNGLKTKTITLSVDMLTTGTTVKEWTAVLMLDNTSDTGKYIQTVFRAQTPWKSTFEDGTTFVKTNAFVFDFNPDRVLKIAEEYANMDTKTGVEIVGNSTADRQTKTRTLINFLPIIAMDEDGEMRYLDAKDAVSIINYTAARKIVDEGFMSNNLFNVKALFRMKGKDYEQVREIMSEISPVSALDKRKNKKQQGEPLAEENPEDTFEIEKEKVISQSNLGEKKFAAIEEATSLGDENLDLVLERATEQAGEEITKEDLEKFEQAKKPFEEAKKKQKTEEEKFRDHLRGFARTIPVLLMAYAHSEMTFENFEKRIPQVDFEQVTGITKEQFEYLRQARDDSGEPIFVESAFNSAIHEFLKRKRTTEHYYKSEAEGDIYDNIPSQENNRVFTPKRVVNMMLDAFEAENPAFFKSDKVKILDPYVKSGNFLAEAAKRFYKYSKDKDIERIIENQLFGIAPFDIYATLAQETVYSFADTKFKHRLRNRNIRPEPQIEELVKAGKLEEVIKEHFGNMKFDVVIGNPPYQEETKDTSDKPIYNYFMSEAYKFADKVCFITPARFLFNAGKTPKKWNAKMLNDKHLKVAYYEQDSSNVFPNTDIKGGVAITYRDTQKNFGKIGTFTHFEELNSILRKVVNNSFESIEPIVGVQLDYKFKKEFNISQVGLKTNVFNKQKHLFTDSRVSDTQIAILGLNGRSRIYKYIEEEYFILPQNHQKWKVYLPTSNGSGAIGEVLSTPLIGHTETFIGIGEFDNQEEAENLLKYIKTKFARTMLGTLKITQHNLASTWKNVPLQNFTNNSDIDWSQSIAQIDQQLYKKYGLSEKEIAFIEEKVREMK